MTHRSLATEITAAFVENELSPFCPWSRNSNEYELKEQNTRTVCAQENGCGLLIAGCSFCPEQPWSGTPNAEEDDPDGGGDRGRHGLSQRQQVRAQGPRCQELHGGWGLHCQNWRWALLTLTQVMESSWKISVLEGYLFICVVIYLTEL